MNGQKIEKMFYKIFENIRVLGDVIYCIDGILYKNNKLILLRFIKSQILKIFNLLFRNC